MLDVEILGWCGYVWSAVVLGGMTKNLYHGIFQNYTGFTVYDSFFFMHDRALTTFSTD